MIRYMAPTPRPAGWKGGSEDFGFLRTLDGHIANDRSGSGTGEAIKFGYANVRWGFDRTDLSGTEYGTDYDIHEDLHESGFSETESYR